MQNVLKDEEEWALVITSEDMDGCPPDLVSNARQAAIDRNHDGADDHVITLGRSLVEPFLTYSSRRSRLGHLVENCPKNVTMCRSQSKYSVFVSVKPN